MILSDWLRLFYNSLLLKLPDDYTVLYLPVHRRPLCPKSETNVY